MANHFRIYQPGKPLPPSVREAIVDYIGLGYGITEVSRMLGVSKASVSNVSRHFVNFGTTTPFCQGGREPSKLTLDILEVIEMWKLRQPSMYAYEIQNRLLAENICNPQNVPSLGCIRHGLRDIVGMTKKKITPVAKEKLTDENKRRTDEFLDLVSRRPASSLHFFDESSVIKTTSNRKYGNSYRGQPALELQRYASNATYTINLLHSASGVDHFNVIPGSSNGHELIAFFENAVADRNGQGMGILLHGDTVIMDNCGFHHGRFIEPLVRDTLSDVGVDLVFQPPYSPELNTCELCFNQIKKWLQVNNTYAEEETMLAIIDAVSAITPRQSVGYFNKCGYLIP